MLVFCNSVGWRIIFSCRLFWGLIGGGVLVFWLICLVSGLVGVCGFDLVSVWVVWILSFAYFGLRFVVLLFGSVCWLLWVFDIWVAELLYFGILAGFLFSGGFFGFL